MPTQLLPTLIAAVTTTCASWCLGRLAPRLDWVDGGDRGHKLGVARVSLAGGAAILCGLLAGWACINALGRDSASFVPGRELLALFANWLGPGATLLPWGAVLVAFAVGLIDDLAPNGLNALSKLAGQALAGIALGLPLFWSAPSTAHALGATLLLVLGAVIVQNALNTFDTADGIASGLALAALAVPAPLFAAPIAAFTPFNFARGTGRTPKSILGDSGSHVLGILILLTPAAWPALALPLFDLARLVVVRAKAARKPWVGDRCHLAHRLELRGLRPLAVAAVLVAAASPSIALGYCGLRGWLPGGVALGALLTAVAFVALLRWAPAPSEIVDADASLGALRSDTGA